MVFSSYFLRLWSHFIETTNGGLLSRLQRETGAKVLPTKGRGGTKGWKCLAFPLTGADNLDMLKKVKEKQGQAPQRDENLKRVRFDEDSGALLLIVVLFNCVSLLLTW